MNNNSFVFLFLRFLWELVDQITHEMGMNTVWSFPPLHPRMETGGRSSTLAPTCFDSVLTTLNSLAAWMMWISAPCLKGSACEVGAAIDWDLESQREIYNMWVNAQMSLLTSSCKRKINGMLEPHSGDVHHLDLSTAYSEVIFPCWCTSRRPPMDSFYFLEMLMILHPWGGVGERLSRDRAEGFSFLKRGR